MDEKKLVELLGNIDEILIEEAAPKSVKKSNKPMWVKFGNMAACLLLVGGLSISGMLVAYKNTEKQNLEHQQETIEQNTTAKEENTETVGVDTNTALMINNSSKGESKDFSKEESAEESPSFSAKQIATADVTDEGFPDWGLLLIAEDVTASGMTLVCTQSGGKLSGTLQTGSEYKLLVLENDTWNDVPTIVEEYGWNSMAYLIEKETCTEFEMNWEWLYGKLSEGTYRLVKRFTDFRKTGDYDNADYWIEFDITATQEVTITPTPEFFEDIMPEITPTLRITPEVTEVPEDTASSEDTLIEIEEEKVAILDTDIYKQPKEDSEKIGFLPKGERVLVTGIYVIGQFTETTNWYRVTYEDSNGYVRADCLHLLNNQITPRTAIIEGEKDIRVGKTPLVMKNTLYFEFLYTTDSLQCWSENPDIVQAALFECGYDFEMNANVAGVMLYGIGTGECGLVIVDGSSQKEVRRLVTVEKPESNTGRQQLIDYLLLYGDVNEIGDKVRIRYGKELGNRVVMEYSGMDDNLHFYYYETQEDEEIEWSLFPTEQEMVNLYEPMPISTEETSVQKEKIEYYMTMRIGDAFITTVVDLATYQGEAVEFEKGWFRVPVEEELQKRANEITKRAFAAASDFLFEETGLQLSDIK